MRVIIFYASGGVPAAEDGGESTKIS